MHSGDKAEEQWPFWGTVRRPSSKTNQMRSPGIQQRFPSMPLNVWPTPASGPGVSPNTLHGPFFHYYLLANMPHFRKICISLVTDSARWKQSFIGAKWGSKFDRLSLARSRWLFRLFWAASVFPALEKVFFCPKKKKKKNHSRCPQNESAMERGRIFCHDLRDW